MSKALRTAFLVGLALLTLYPFWYVAIHSVSDPVSGARAWALPRDFFTMNYTMVFMTEGIWRAYLVTVGRTAVGTVLYLLVTGMAAFVFSRKELKGRNTLLVIYLIVMYFDGGIIAFYVLMRHIGMYNSYLVYVLPAAYGVWGMIVMKTSFKQIPDSLMEAALIDGAGYFRIFAQITVPLSLALFATMGLFQAVVFWSDWFVGSFYMSDSKKWTLQTFLQITVLKGKVSTGLSFADHRLENLNWPPDRMAEMYKLTTLSMESAFIMVSIVPILLVYPFLQKYFVKGVLLGSIKE